MSNLLPERNKKYVKREYLLRLFAVMLALSFLTLLFSVLSLIPSYFFSNSRAEIALERIESIKKYTENSQRSEITSLLLTTNQKLAVLNGPDNIKLNRAIKTILNEKGNQIKISSFSFREGGISPTLVVEGNALSREALISFSENLEATNAFGGVDLPISNLAKSSDIDFDIRIDFKINQEDQ